MVVTGIRWAESARRSKRRMTEACFRDKNRHFLHPIIDWPTETVWGYIRRRGLPYCSLYDEGFDRVGCVLCPMACDTERQMARWPKIAASWERAVKETFKPDDGRWGSADEYWAWWLNRRAPSLERDDDNMLLFEDQ